MLKPTNWKAGMRVYTKNISAPATYVDNKGEIRESPSLVEETTGGCTPAQVAIIRQIIHSGQQQRERGRCGANHGREEVARDDEWLLDVSSSAAQFAKQALQQQQMLQGLREQREAAMKFMEERITSRIQASDQQTGKLKQEQNQRKK